MQSKKWLSGVLSTAMLLGSWPAAASAAPSEIWPGYPGVDELPVIQTIPDPFKFFDTAKDPTGDGYVSSPEEWISRRSELQELVQRYWLGYRYPTAASDVSGLSEVVMEPNAITVGINWPPSSTATVINLRDAFDQLVDKLQTESVEVRQVIPASSPFGAPTLGETIGTYGPATDSESAQAAALEAWNAGYYVPYTSFGSANYAVLRSYTGTLSGPPEPIIPVTYHTVTVANPERGVSERFKITISRPSAEQVARAWGDPDAQVPAIIDIGGAVSQTAAVLEQGYAHIRFTPTDIYPDDSSAADGINRDGVYTRLYPYDKDQYEYASGALMAWGWGVSQIISALEQPVEGADTTWGEQLGINPAQTLVTGHSRYGKAAMFAAAFDERIRICLSSEPGGSGIQSYRYKVEGKIFNFNTYPKADRVYGKTEIPTVSYGKGSSWFPETAAHFVNKDRQLPFDSSDIIALVAPRPFFAVTGIDTHWLGNEGGVAAVQAAAEVYAYVGRDPIEQGNIAVRARQSDHVLYNRDIPFVIAIMDREFKQDEADRQLHVQDLYPEGNGSLGSMSYPARDYDSLSAITSSPFEINSAYLPWSRPDKYSLWTAQENFLVGYPVTITAHSNAPDAQLVLPDGTAIKAAGHEGDQFIFRLTAEQAVYGRYELRTVGADKANRSVYFAAVSLADSLRHAPSKGDEGEENRLIGFSSRLSNDAANPPVVLIDGKPTTMSFTPERVKPEETTLLEYGIQFHDPLFARIANEGWDADKTFHIRNLQFVTLPGFTFEISLGNITASAANAGKEGAARFTRPISWQVERYNNGPATVWPEVPDTKTEKDLLLQGLPVPRPLAPTATNSGFKAEIAAPKVSRIGDKTRIELTLQAEMDRREFGFGLDIADDWQTHWSEDGRRVMLDVDYEQFPEGASAELIVFRLQTKEGQLIAGPVRLSLTHPRSSGGNPSGPGYIAPPADPSDADNDPLTPQLEGRSAVARITAEALARLFADGGEAAIAAVEGAQAYGLRMPAKSLAEGSGASRFTLATDLGRLTIPDHLLRDWDGPSDSEAVIAIGQSHSAGLPDRMVRAIGERPVIELTLTAGGQPAAWHADAGVTVELPYVLPASQARYADRLVVWRVGTDGQAHVVPDASYDLKAGKLTFTASAPGRYAVALEPLVIADAAAVPWAEAAILTLTDRGAFRLEEDRLFRPRDQITRAEFMYGLVRALELQAPVGTGFVDVSPAAYYATELAIARQLGIAQGTGDDLFRPEERITRQDMMTLAARTLAQLGKLDIRTPGAELERFRDYDAIAPYALESIGALVQERLVLGDHGQLRPKSHTTRAEAAVFLERIASQS